MTDRADTADDDDASAEAWAVHVARSRDHASASVVRPYDSTVKDLVFECWTYLADRNAARALAMARDHAEPETELPDVRTVRRWVKDDDWQTKADARIAAAAPMLRDRAVLRLIGMTVPAGDRIFEAVNGELRGRKDISGAAIMAEQQSAWRVFDAVTGLGASKSVDPPPPSDDRETAAELAELTPLEASRRASELLRETTAARKGASKP